MKNSLLFVTMVTSCLSYATFLDAQYNLKMIDKAISNRQIGEVKRMLLMLPLQDPLISVAGESKKERIMTYALIAAIKEGDDAMVRMLVIDLKASPLSKESITGTLEMSPVEYAQQLYDVGPERGFIIDFLEQQAEKEKKKDNTIH